MLKLGIRTICAIVLFVLSITVVSYLFKEQITLFCHQLFDAIGLPAIPIGFFSTSIFFSIIPDDLFSAAALLGGVEPWLVFFLASLGSVAGASSAYFLGKRLKDSSILVRVTGNHRDEVKELVTSYGYKALAVATLTPLPDAPFSWICGAHSISFTKFIVTYSICRSFKIGYMIYLLKVGQAIISH